MSVLHARHDLVSRSRLAAAATVLGGLLAAACEPSSTASPNAGDGADAATTERTDAGPTVASDAADAHASKADAAAPFTARQIELARMQAHLDSLYAQTDVVHRFATAYGDGVDCVPFPKQPGYAQVGSMNGAPPSLAAQPSFARATSLPGFGDGSDASGNVRACPSGTVPIRQVRLNDLARFATLEDYLAKEPVHVRDQSDAVGFSHEHAGHSLFVPNWGAQATLNLWKPAVEPDDFSLSQIWVFGGGPFAQVQTVEAGYIASPQQYGDAEPRLFIYSTTDGYNPFNTNNCFDLQCKAFVQLADSHVLIGGKFDKASALNGEQREFTLRWQLCPASECQDWEGWWLRYDGGATSTWVGFYPRARYNALGLHDAGARLEFGGEVAFKRNATHTTTDMGSGQPGTAGFGVAAYQTNLLRITTGHAWSALGSTATDDQAPACYESGVIADLSPRVSSATFFFGGAGQSEACK